MLQHNKIILRSLADEDMEALALLANNKKIFLRTEKFEMNTGIRK